MKHEISREGIDSTQYLVGLRNRVDEAVEVNLKVIQNNHDLTDFKGVWNVTKDRFANVVSKNYQIIQHRDILEALSGSLSRLGIQVSGLAKQYNNTMVLDLVFGGDKEIIVSDGKQGIKLGMKIINSYDKTASFRMEMFGYRIICKNGMALGKALNDIRSVTLHLGDPMPINVISIKVEKFIAEMVNSSERLQRYVNDCMEDSIEWKLAEKFLEAMVKSKKHKKKIYELIDEEEAKEQGVTRWVLYNALTNYATHGEHLSPNVETYLQNLAQDVLRGKMTVPEMEQEI